MKAKIFFTGLLFAVLFFYSLSYAEVPEYINYQGKLTTPQGALIDTTVSMTFVIYADSIGGEPLWSETCDSVKVMGGIFNYIVGAHSYKQTLATIFDGSVRYLGVKVGSDPEMVPRQPMVSVAYAFRSVWADSTEFCVIETVFYDTMESDWEVSGENVFTGHGGLYPSGNVGIGTTTPAEKLDVVGNIHATGSVGSGSSIRGQGVDVNGPDRILTDGQIIYLDREAPYNSNNYQKDIRVGIADISPDASLEISGKATATWDFFMLSSTDNADGDLFIVKNDPNPALRGRVGIATTNPQAQLDVACPSNPNSYIRLDPEISPTPGSCDGVAIWLNEHDNQNRLAITAYDATCGNFIYTEDPSVPAGPGQGFGIAGGSYFNPFERFVVNTDEMFLGYSIWPGDGSSAGGNDGAGNLYVNGNVGIGTTNPQGLLQVGQPFIVTGDEDVGISHSADPEYTPDAKLEIVREPGKDLLMLSSTAAADGDLVIVKNGGNVGIGYTDPGSGKLSVNGRLQVGSNATVSPGLIDIYVKDADGSGDAGIYLDAPTTTSRTGIQFSQGFTYRWMINIPANSTDLRFHGQSPGDLLTLTQSGRVGIGTTTPGTKLAVYGLPGTSSYNNVRVNTATGDFYYQTSSKRYKQSIQPLEDDFYKILQSKPRSFIDKASGEREIGYIAEEFDEIGLNNLVIYDKNGQPDGLKYELVSLYLLEVMKDQVEAVKELKAENQELRQRIEALEGKR